MPNAHKLAPLPPAHTAAAFDACLLQTLTASVTDNIVVFGADGHIQLFNAGSEKLFGYSSAEALAMNFQQLVPVFAKSGSYRHLVGTRQEVNATHKDKSSFRVCLSVNCGSLDAGNLYVGMMQKVGTPEPDQAARWSESRLQAMLDGVTDAIVTVDTNGMIESFNKTASTLFGYSPNQVVGHPVTMLMPSPYGAEAGQQQTGLSHMAGNSDGRVVIGRKQDGSAFPMEITIGETMDGGQHLFIGFIRDITGRRGTRQRVEQLQAELLRVSRLDAMGQMTLAIAHELNQPLAAISNYVSAVKQSLNTVTPDPGVVRSVNDLIDKATTQTQRAAAIIKGLRGFVEKREIRREAVDLGPVIEEALALAFVSAASAGVKVHLALDHALGKVLIDRVQIQQVLFNLIRNALEAMQYEERRELFLTTRSGADNFAEVTVEDTGPGLTDDIAENLFRPFVTNKDNGMGVGLTICQSIIEAHGGRIWLAQTSPAGAVFRFRLPLAPGESK